MSYVYIYICICVYIYIYNAKYRGLSFFTIMYGVVHLMKHLIVKNGERTQVVAAVRRQYSFKFSLVDIMCSCSNVG